MRRSAIITAMAMSAMAAGLAVVSGASQAIEAGPEPVRFRKRTVLRPTTYRPPRGRLPHLGAKERARHAGKPDGPMHGLPLLHREGAPA
jgi:hypothetical protein